MTVTRSVRIALLTTIAALVATLAPATASAEEPPPTFDVALLARPLGFQTVPFDLNDDGVAVGYYLDFSLNYRSIMWEADGTPVDLAGSGSWSQAHAIASDGTIGGYYGPTLSDTDPATNDGSGWSDLRLRRRYSGGSVEGINANGRAVGWSHHTRTRSNRPALWRNGRMTVLATSGAANDINDDNVIAGWTNVNGFPQAVIWDGTTMTQLEGDRGSAAVAISANGLIAGHTPDPVTNAGRAAVWSDAGASPQHLDLVDGAAGQAKDINSSGWVVGVARFDSYNLAGDPVLWMPDGTAHNLNDLIPEGTGWNLVSAVAVNDQGQILGFGSCTCAPRTSAFLLTPRS